ncbi:MAG: hypothetical protein KBT34_05365 [Prevotella sp.]|nr:hypothetical protein [Candidatus Prevotella equi]
MAIERFKKGEVLTADKMNLLLDEINAKPNKQDIEDNEKVTAAALNDLLQRISSLETIVKENEKIVASAVNDIR